MMKAGKPHHTILCHSSVFQQLINLEAVEWSINSRGAMMGRVNGCAVLIDDGARVESVKSVLKRAGLRCKKRGRGITKIP
jgi:hypothetical protein